jgi:hypothetical protein
MPRFYSIDQGVIPIKAVKPCSGDQRVSPDLSNPFLDPETPGALLWPNRIGKAMSPIGSRPARGALAEMTKSLSRPSRRRPRATSARARVVVALS